MIIILIIIIIIIIIIIVTIIITIILNRGHPGYYLSGYLTDNSGSKVGRTSELKTKPTRELCCLVQLSTSDQLTIRQKLIGNLPLSYVMQQPRQRHNNNSMVKTSKLNYMAE